MSTASYRASSYLSIRSAYAPSFSPDGNSVTFLWDVTGVPQLWQVGIDGGWPRQLTFFDERISRYSWSPTDQFIAFAMDTGGDERDQLYLLDTESGVIDALTNDPSVMHIMGPWSPDGTKLAFTSNARTGTYFDAYAIDVGDRTVRLVWANEGSNSAVGWSPDGVSLLTSRSEANIYNDLFLVDVDSGEARPLTSDGGVTAYSHPVFSRDGRSIFVASNRDREFKGLAKLEIEDGGLHWIAETDWDVEGISLSRSGDSLAYAINDGGYSRLVIRDLSSGDERTVDSLPTGTIQNPRGSVSIEWAPDDSAIAVTVDGSADNANVWLVDSDDMSSRKLTGADAGGVDSATFVSPTSISFPTFDGLEIPALLYASEGATPNGSNPVILHVHGGPEGQDRPYFNPIYQFFVSRGYTVLAPNVRGSSGYGRTYIHLDDVRKRMDSVHDLKYAQQWLIDSGWADKDRIAVMGGSYGGFMTLSAITTYPELWKCAVELYGIGDFLTFMQNTSSYRRRLRALEYGDPETDADFLREISPLNHIDRIRCPLMVLHGARDPRVPISETEQLVEALEARVRTVEYVRFEDEGHGFVKRPNRIQAYSAIGDFLDRNL